MKKVILLVVLTVVSTSFLNAMEVPGSSIEKKKWAIKTPEINDQKYSYLIDVFNKSGSNSEKTEALNALIELVDKHYQATNAQIEKTKDMAKRTFLNLPIPPAEGDPQSQMYVDFFQEQLWSLQDSLSQKKELLDELKAYKAVFEKNNSGCL